MKGYTSQITRYALENGVRNVRLTTRVDEQSESLGAMSSFHARLLAHAEAKTFEIKGFYDSPSSGINSAYGYAANKIETKKAAIEEALRVAQLLEKRGINVTINGKDMNTAKATLSRLQKEYERVFG
ncbi:MAG: hypothetical protein NT120_02750 [Candidatus Aenigmarchaeota archaeon]|nr:hypothetical protein [Candidatus Aenigmarchaeota archaeon]